MESDWTEEQIAEIDRTLRLLLEPGQLTELRALGVSTSDYRKPHTVGGFFQYDHLEAMIEEACLLNGDAVGVYFLANKIDPALLARSSNRVRQELGDYGLTKNPDVLTLRWFLIDADPIRPSGISSTDMEHDAAIRKVKVIREFLAEQGWPEPILADSGNGAHLVYGIDLSPKDADLLRKALDSLAFMFDDSEVKIDVENFNPSRIFKLYGTLCRKGDDTPERPHRYSSLLEVPETIIPVQRELLEGLGARVPEAPTAGTKASKKGKFNIDEWIDQRLLKHVRGVSHGSEWKGGRRWILQVCPWNNDHTDRSAYIVELKNGAIAAGCHHESCKGKGWKDLRALVEPDRNAEGEEKDSEVDIEGGGSSRFIKEGVFIPKLLADEIMDQFHFKYAAERLWVYDNGVYRPKGEMVVKSEGQRLLGEGARDNRLRETFNFIARATYDDISGPNLQYINLRNGLLDWKARKLIRHSPDIFQIAQLPVVYDPDARCPVFDWFLETTLPPDVQALVEEILGHPLIPDNRFERVIALLGMGANGKSVFLDAAHELLGDENVSNVALQDLEKNRFASAELFGKLANIFADLSPKALESSNMLKALVSGDRIAAERKFGQPFHFRNTAKLIFSANRLPMSLDRTFAFYRRWIIIPFEKTFTGQRADKELRTKLRTPEELSGILNRALTGLDRLYHNQEFSVPDRVWKALDTYRLQNDSVATFCKESVVWDGKGMIVKAEFYEKYKEWCEQEGLKPVSHHKVKESLRQCFPSLDEGRSGTGPRYWIGFRWYGSVAISQGAAKESSGE
ncbi:phage/plasmid primase, P4 family [Acidobacteriota bacterium]